MVDVDMEDPPQFHLFPALPMELRLKIWAMALSNPRTVHLSCKKSEWHKRTPEVGRKIESFSSIPGVPALLHVNRESRHEALNYYTSCFITPRSELYINFAHDIVRFPDNMLVSIPRKELESITHVVLEVKDKAYFGHFNMETVKKMSNCKEMKLMVPSGAIYLADTVRDPLAPLIGSFEDAMREDPGWECPRILIFDKDSGEELSVLEGGASIPGWVAESTSDSGGGM